MLDKIIAFTIVGAVVLAAVWSFWRSLKGKGKGGCGCCGGACNKPMEVKENCYSKGGEGPAGESGEAGGPGVVESGGPEDEKASE